MEELRKLVYKLGFVFEIGDNENYSGYEFYKADMKTYALYFNEMNNLEELDIQGTDISFYERFNSSSPLIGLNSKEAIKKLKEDFKHILRKEKINNIIK